MSQKAGALKPAQQSEVRHHQLGQEVFKTILPEDVDWKPFPAFPPSVRLAVVVGQPSEPGPYTIRVKSPHGAKLMPHKHPGVATFWQRASATSQTERGASGLDQHGRASTARNAPRGKLPAAVTPPRPWVGSSAFRNVPSCL